MKNCAYKKMGLAVAAALLSFGAQAEDAPKTFTNGSWDGEFGLQYRQFYRYADVPPSAPAQDMDTSSASLLAHYNSQWNDGKNSFVLSPFMRYDSMDPARSHIDLREMMWTWDRDKWTWRAGVGKVFWGVSEANHLVDVVNQTDMVEDIKGEDKLGQPMLRATHRGNWGTVDMFVMTGFRERTLPSSYGRPGSGLALQDYAVTYQSADKNMQPEVAMRWSKSLGALDIGVSGFIGNNRVPQLLTTGGIPLLGLATSPAPFVVNLDTIQARFAALTPAQQAAVTSALQSNSSIYYSRLAQFGIDASYLVGDWTFKFEGVNRDIGNDTYMAGMIGAERTYSGIFHKPWDITYYIEYNNDSRGQNSQAVLQNDLFLGARLALNDEASTEFKLGGFFDLASADRSMRLEINRRLSDKWKARFIGQSFYVRDTQDVLYMYHDDSYAQIDLIRYF